MVQQEKRSCFVFCPSSYFVLFQNTFKIAFCAEFGQKCVLKKVHKKIMSFVLFDLPCSFYYFLLFFLDLVKKMSSNRAQKRTKKIMPPGKSQDVLCLFCCSSV